MEPPELHTLCEAGTNFYDRGYSFGSTGNLSVRVNEKSGSRPQAAL